MRMRVEPRSGVPIRLQIGRQIRLALACGRLSRGQRLPSARDLAADLGVNYHTVRNAYRDLEQDGLLVVERGRGTRVARQAARLGEDDLRRIVRRHLGRLVEDLAGPDADRASLRRLVDDELRRVLAAAGEGDA